MKLKCETSTNSAKSFGGVRPQFNSQSRLSVRLLARTLMQTQRRRFLFREFRDVAFSVNSLSAFISLALF